MHENRRKIWVLITVCLAAFAINLDTTIVNVALPRLSQSLDAGTRDLQWVVDGYNLSFAALVLAGGSIGDRYGRRLALLVGLLAFAGASLVGAYAPSAGALIGTRLVMGLGAALIYPSTLSVITATFRDRKERAGAIGAWGAVTGMGVAFGPVTGGLLLDHFWSGSVFLALVPVAVIAAGMVAAFVPPSRDPAAARLDPPGLALATVMLGVLVYTVIEAPGAGWLSVRSLGGFAAAVVLLAAFVHVERRRIAPMLDVRLFRNPAFSAASGSVTVAFFALFGFIFLITQFFQYVKGYSTLSAGVRTLPVAGAIAVSSVLGTKLAVRYGTRVVVCSGLTMFGAAFAWIGTVPVGVSYGTIAAQMVLLGGGLGLTATPATESIMGVVEPAKAGIGSAMNDATREVGGTLGVAVLGSLFTSLYGSRVFAALGALPDSARAAAKGSVGAAQQLTETSPGLRRAVDDAFLTGLHGACFVAAGVCLVGAVAAAVFLPRGTSNVAGRAEFAPPAPEQVVANT